MSFVFASDGMRLSRYIAQQNAQIRFRNIVLDMGDACTNFRDAIESIVIPEMRRLAEALVGVWESLPWQLRLIIRMKQELPEWMFDIVARFIPGKWGEWARDLSTVDK